MKYIDCKKYAQEILDRVKEAPYKMKLAIITVGEDPASKSYVRGKMKDCEYCGIPVEHIKIEDNENAKHELMYNILQKNRDVNIAGIIVQLPLPEWMGDPERFTKLIYREKDVDGFRKDSPFEPCTPKGIMYLLKEELGDLTGMTALVIGRSNIVGKPLAKMLLDADCTVTVTHSKTDRYWLLRHLHDANIVISAVGKLNFLDLGDCWDGELVVDVGINRNEDGKLCGDCYYFDEEEHPCLKVTPVPGGVGLLTRAMLMQNVLEASLTQRLNSSDRW